MTCSNPKLGYFGLPRSRRRIIDILVVQLECQYLLVSPEGNIRFWPIFTFMCQPKTLFGLVLMVFIGFPPLVWHWNGYIPSLKSSVGWLFTQSVLLCFQGKYTQCWLFLSVQTECLPFLFEMGHVAVHAKCSPVLWREVFGQVEQVLVPATLRTTLTKEPARVWSFI